jgi:hypothetical protein
VTWREEKLKMKFNPSPAARRHVADQLGVSPDAPPSDARAAFLRALPAAGFLPAPPLCAAAAALTARAIPGAAAAMSYQEDESSLSAEFDTFARGFWSVSPAARRERWQTWVERSANDALLAARVRRLEAGVDLPDAAERAATPRQRQLIDMTQTLFVLEPIERAARRRELLDGLPPPTRAWQTAAHEIARDFPAHASLEPALIERLSNWTQRMAAPAAAANRQPATWGFQTQGGLQMPQVRASKRRPSGFGVSGVGLFIFISVLLRLILGLGTGPSNPVRIAPTYTPAPIVYPAKSVKSDPGLEKPTIHSPVDDRLEDAIRRAREWQRQHPAPAGEPP